MMVKGLDHRSFHLGDFGHKELNLAMMNKIKKNEIDADHSACGRKCGISNEAV